MSVKDGIQQLAHNPKVAGGVAGMTAAMGAAVETTIDWIPDDIGKLATLIGIILTVILIRVHLTSLEKAQLELRIMKEKEAEHRKAADLFVFSGQPLRRDDDIED